MNPKTKKEDNKYSKGNGDNRQRKSNKTYNKFEGRKMTVKENPRKIVMHGNLGKPKERKGIRTKARKINAPHEKQNISETL